MLFQDIADQEHVFGLLDELASQPPRQAVTDFRNPACQLMLRLCLLSENILGVEKKHGFDQHKTSYQRALVNQLIWLLEYSDRADKLAAALPEVKELLYKAWAIDLEIMCGRLKPLADTAEKLSSGGKRGHESAYGTQSQKEAERDQWQQWIDDAVNDYPEWSYERIKKHVVKNHANAVSLSQLKRYTKDPRKIKLVQ